MKFRHHRGALSDSMATQIEVNSMEELLKHLNKSWNNFGVNIENIRFSDYGFDKRINQKVFLVLGVIKNEEIVLGMSDSDTF